jgi:uncharacterized Zn finger protein (UPF0148 family)
MKQPCKDCGEPKQLSEGRRTCPQCTYKRWLKSKNRRASVFPAKPSDFIERQPRGPEIVPVPIYDQFVMGVFR